MTLSNLSLSKSPSYSQPIIYKKPAQRACFDAGVLSSLCAFSVDAKHTPSALKSPRSASRNISDGSGLCSSRSSSALTRSPLRRAHSAIFSPAARSVPSSITNPSCEAKRKARSIRSASSLKRSSGRPTARITRLSRSFCPWNGSISPLSGL